MLFDVVIIGDNKNLYLKQFGGRSNFRGVPNYFQFDFNEMKFMQIKEKIYVKFDYNETETNTDPNYGFVLIFDEKEFFKNKQNLTRKEAFILLNYIFNKMYSKDVKYPRDSLHFRIKKAIDLYKAVYKDDDFDGYNLHAQYRNLYAGQISIDKRERTLGAAE
ncbi:hypothetical protein OFO01_03790 [Campylobacter sp. JMF_01 NE2]|uniref:hypothetical protein n=1 Tax=unclassified Campylobacter TaxID=2593542 RepID=UPI0022E99B87|nr:MULTISPECIES: hypothetical protein [unclassified Campylobacter]MDA3052568.1 hypothetical protein [Campylobacter sp. JMF_03 NE3]MDA3066900.1 hypothetical protein [Campylobacter sp. JMF_01 NE2]